MDNTARTVRIIQPANGNPGPLGLFAFAITTFIANVYALGLGVPPGGGGSLVCGFAIWYGGIVQILAGMWALKVGNTFEGTAFSSFGAYWVAYGMMFWPGVNIASTYNTSEEYQNAKAIFLLAWTILALILTISTTKSTITTVTMLIFLDIHLIFEVGNFFAHLGDAGWANKVSSVAGILSALMAFYNGAAALWLPTNSHILLPVGPLTREKDVDEMV
ncbi:hypothetical protein BGW42_004077 [Actinomortierella wolfii]|nr:hypothetical protein BGW42_004077 [Actinomortierella wolfii]